MVNQIIVEDISEGADSMIAAERYKMEPKIKELKKVALEQFKNYPELIKYGHVEAIKEVAKKNSQEALFNKWSEILNKIIQMSESVKARSGDVDIWELKEVEYVAEELLQDGNYKLLIDFYFYSSQLKSAVGEKTILDIFNAKLATGAPMELNDFSSLSILAIQWLPRFPLFFEGKPLPYEDEILKAKFSHYKDVFKKIAGDVNEYQRNLEGFIVNGMSLTRFVEEATAMPHLIYDFTFEELISLFPEGAGVIPTELLNEKRTYTQLLKSNVEIADLNLIAAKMSEITPPIKIKIELGEPLNKILIDHLSARKLSVHEIVTIKKAFIKLKTGLCDSDDFIKKLKMAGIKLQEKDKNLIKQIPVEPVIAKLNARTMPLGDQKTVVMPTVSSQSFHDFDKAWKDTKNELEEIFKVFHSRPAIIRYVSQILEATSFTTILNSIAHESRLGTAEKMKLKRLADAMANVQQKMVPIKDVLEAGKQQGRYKYPEAEEMALLTTAARVGNPLVFSVIKDMLPYYSGNAEQLAQLIREIKSAMQGENVLSDEQFRGQLQAAFPSYAHIGIASNKIFTEYQRQGLIRKISDESLSFNVQRLLSANPQIALNEVTVKIINDELSALKKHEINLQKFSNHLGEHLNWPVGKPDFQVLLAGHQQFVRNELHVDEGYQQGLHLTALVDARLEKIQETVDELNKKFKKPLWGTLKDFPGLLAENQKVLQNLYGATAQTSKTLKILQHVDKPSFAGSMQCKESKVDTIMKGWQYNFRVVMACSNLLEQNCLRNVQDTVKSFNKEIERLHVQAEKMYSKQNVRKLDETLEQCKQMQNKIDDLIATINQLPAMHNQNLNASLQAAKANLTQLKESDLKVASSYTQNCIRKLQDKGVVSKNYSFADNVKAFFGFKKKEYVELKPVKGLESLSSIDTADLPDKAREFVEQATGKNRMSL